MILQSTDYAIVRRAVQARQVIADGPVDLSSTWLAEGDRRVIAEESGALLDAIDTPRLEAAFRRAGVDQLLAISNDPLVVEDLVYELGVGSDDLNALSSELAGINTLLVPAFGLELAVLCTVDDFRLVAGNTLFVRSYVPDLTKARQDFLDFADGHGVAELQLVLRHAASYMDRPHL